MVRRRTTQNVGRGIAAVGAVFAAACVSLTGLAAFHEGVQHGCLVEGPFRDSPPYPLLSEAVEVRGYFSWLPLGRACEWERADGAGFITALPDWSATVPVLVGVLISMSGIIVLVVSRRKKA